MTVINFSDHKAARDEQIEYRAFMDQIVELVRNATFAEKQEVLAAFEAKDSKRLRAVIDQIQENKLINQRRQWIRETNTTE